MPGGHRVRSVLPSGALRVRLGLPRRAGAHDIHIDNCLRAPAARGERGKADEGASAQAPGHNEEDEEFHTRSVSE